jgi:hypothetical protein
MPIDRRDKMRREPGRRRGLRSFIKSWVTWICNHDGHSGRCRLIEYSDSGAALMTYRHTAPKVGAYLQLRIHGRPCPRQLEVVRIDDISSRDVIVAAEFK